MAGGFLSRHMVGKKEAIFMRIVFSGASLTAIVTARHLIRQGHDVAIIEVDKDKIDDISEEMDCSFLLGNAGTPDVLEQVDPQQCDFLFCLTDDDHANIITSLLGRSMGFSRVITGIQDASLVSLCNELGLDDTIIPTRTISRHLCNIVEGLDSIELSTLLRGSARLFSFKATKNDQCRIDELELPDKARVIFYYRDDRFFFADGEDNIHDGDELIILTDYEHLAELNERWNPKGVHRDQESGNGEPSESSPQDS
jgi:trk system potassium uptake protein TrkA